MSTKFLQKLFLLLCVLSLCSMETLTAQTLINVEGNITSKQGQNSLANVSVTVKGTKNGTKTDDKGYFRLQQVASNATLIFSSVGYAEQTISVNGGSIHNVIMDAAEGPKLDEVVVVGYGTRSKKDVTGAVSQIKATQLENENPASVTDVLRGNIAGLSISQTNSASAKGGGDLLVRGKSSVNAGTSPLIVLDGVIYPGQLSDINPNDIATIDVLKDASSAAVFGAKAASGVVLISTKRGAGGAKPTISFNTNIGYGELARNQPVYDGPGFIAWRTDVLKSTNVTAPPYRYNDPRTLPAGTSIDTWREGQTGDSITVWLNRLKMFPVEIANYKAGKQTNWYDQMFHKGLRQDHTLSISNRTDKVSYYMSMNYTNNQGVILGDAFKTFRMRINLEAKAAKFMSVGVNMQFADRDESQVPVDWPQMINASPYGEKYKADGVTLRDSPNDDVGNNLNPFQGYVYTTRLQKTNTLFGSLYAKGDLGLGFSYQVNFTPNFEFYRYFNGNSAKSFPFAAVKGSATRTDQTTYNWQVDNLLKWNKTFGDHQLDFTFLYNAEKFQSWKSQMDNQGFDPNDILSYHNIGAGIKPVISSDDQYSTGDALMGRVNYTFKQRYLLTASVRRDGYSAFGQGNPRATFPSIALGWVFTDEAFMKRSASWLNYGKLRVSYGINGNRDIGRYNAISDLSTGKYQYVTAAGAVVLVSQLFVNRLQNPNLQWEKTSSVNLGLDFSLFKNALSGSLEVYKKSTHDLLILRALPDVTGFSNVWDNLGQVDNRGVELTLNSTNIKRSNFAWRTTGTFSLNRNKVVHLYGNVDVVDPLTGKVTGQVERDDVANRWFIGHDLDQIWDLKVLGVWQQNEAAEAAKYGVAPGDFKIQDVNGDGKFSDADRQFLGYKTPRFQWSLRNEFTFYKNFDFSFQIYSIWGQYNDFNQAKNNTGFPDRQNSYIYPYWTKDNPINDYARLFSSNGGANYSVYRKTSNIRLNNVSLGYTIPKDLLTRFKIESLKIYASVNNLASYQPNWNYWDAEYRNRDDVTKAVTIAIPPRYYTLGLNVTF